MDKLLERIRAKLRTRGGESITEVLVAVLISAVALTMLASMIAASTRLIQTSRSQMEKYYEGNRALDLQQDSSGTSGCVVVGDTSIPVYISENALGGTKVYAFWKKNG